MIPRHILEQTNERYRRRRAKREDNVEKLRTGSVLEVDTPERVERRIARITAGEAVRAAPAAASVVALERVLGRSDLMSVNYLELGLRVARCVGRITLRTRTGRTLGYGTGFMVSPRLLLTNNHVLDGAEVAASSRVEFNYQEDPDGNPLRSVVLDLQPEVFFMTDEQLDFTLVAVSERSVDGTELRGFCWLPLIEEQGKVLVGEYVNIIQHPNGEPKQLALRENQLVDLLPDFLHYQTDTAPGSSGSPVFNDQWEVIGLHHSGVPAMRDGQILTRDGTVWREEMGEHRIHWIANEGVRVSRIVQQVKAAALTGARDRLRAQVLGDRPVSERRSGPPEPPGGEAGRSAGVLPTVEGGGATWTIPLQVTVRLGPAIGADSAGGAQPPRADGPDALVQGGVSGGAGVLPADAGALQAALGELEDARRRPYYDQEKDQEDQEQYYEGIEPDADPEDFYRSLSALVSSTHTTTISYKPSRHVYPWVDLHRDLRLRSVYSGKPFDAEELIREDFRIEAERARVTERFRAALAESTLADERLRETLDILEASLPFNCEHVVPQSWFDKKEPMRGDLHHLFTCESRCNSFRGNTPYFDFPDFQEVVRDECGKREEGGFEPSDGKGAVARATLYFLLRYPGQINAVRKEYVPERIATLLDWHRQRPPTEYERHRNAAIFEKQGNRNPLIDHPDWADRIDFALGLGA